MNNRENKEKRNEKFEAINWSFTCFVWNICGIKILWCKLLLNICNSFLNNNCFSSLRFFPFPSLIFCNVSFCEEIFWSLNFHRMNNIYRINCIIQNTPPIHTISFPNFCPKADMKSCWFIIQLWKSRNCLVS